MDNTRIAWQKSIWVSLTLEGDRKNLITPSQRTSSGLACRNIFNTQFVQLLEDYDTYGPHKGFFVPRLEPGNDPEIAFEIHWDVLAMFCTNLVLRPPLSQKSQPKNCLPSTVFSTATIEERNKS